MRVAARCTGRDGTPADLTKARQTDLFVVVIKGKRTDAARAARTLVVDLLPAGFEIETRDPGGADRRPSYSWLKELDRHGLYRGARRPLYRRARPDGGRKRFHARLCRARRHAGRVHLPGARRRGHVRARNRRPHRDRQADRQSPSELVRPTRRDRMHRGGWSRRVLVAGCGNSRSPLPALRWHLADHLPPPALDRSRDLSVLVLARDGSILRGFLTGDGKWRLPVGRDKVDPLYRRMLVAAEDGRFDSHPGVDPLAVLRAVGQLATHRPCRLGRLDPDDADGAAARTAAAHARRESWSRSRRRWPSSGGSRKDDILGALSDAGAVRRQSRRRAGGEPGLFRQGAAPAVAGRGGACWSPFRARRNGCAPTAIPRPRAAARDRVLVRMADKGVISAQMLAEARAEPIPTRRLALPFHAPHLARALRDAAPDAAQQRTTIDPLLQRQLEALLRREAASLDGSATLAAHGRRQPRAPGPRLCRQCRFRRRRRGAARSIWRARCARRARR